MNHSKLIQNTSINLSKESIENGQQKNLLDSFKMELYQNDPIKSNTKNEERKEENDTLDLDDINIQEELQRQDDLELKLKFTKLPEIQAQKEAIEEKTIDLSHNASKFKKSQSDSNLLFNDVDMEEDNESKKTEKVTQNSQNPKSDGKNISKQQ